MNIFNIDILLFRIYNINKEILINLNRELLLMPKSKDELKEYLHSYGVIKNKLDILKEQLYEVRERREPVMVFDSNISQAANHRQLCDTTAKIQILEETIIQQRYYLVCCFENVKKCIDEVDDDTEQAILTYRYLRGMKWDEICDKTYYSWKQVHRIHTRAIEHLMIDKAPLA